MKKTAQLSAIFLAPFLFSACSFVRPAFDGDKLDCHNVPPKIEAPLVATRPVVQLPEPEWTITPEVMVEIRRMLGRERGFLARSLVRREEFAPVVEQIFRDEGVPLSLINLAIVESGFDPHARSYAGAVGIWQFMRSTGRVYGLKIDKHVDERKDPILSTIAAARHLKDLYELYSDWHLALAAYNAGTGGVARAMARARTQDYWTLVRKKKLKVQTARYVPRIIAASVIVKNLQKYDLSTLAGNLDWLREEENVGTEVASWTGHRHPSAG